jgi:uncharacterized protein YacL
MNKGQFWTRLSFYILFAWVIPATFLIYRFNLFSKVDSISIGGWGIVFIVFTGVFFSKLLKAIRNGLPFSMATQILTGIVKSIIPLIIACFASYYLRNCMTEVFQFLVVVTLCQIVAIVVNPLPQWAHENKLEEGKSTMKELFESLGMINKKDGE